MFYQGNKAIEALSDVVSQSRKYFKDCHIHYIANINSSVRRTKADIAAVISLRSHTEAQANLNVIRFKELGATCSVYVSEADYLAAVSIDSVNWSKKIQLVYANGKYSAVEGMRCLAPIIADLRSMSCMNSGVMGRALGWNKYISTQVLRANGIPTPKSWHFKRDTGWKGGIAPQMGVDLIVKNNNEAWGLGVYSGSVLVNAKLEEIEQRCLQVCKDTFSSDLIVQEFIRGPEIYTSVFRQGSNFYVLPPMELRIISDSWEVGEPIGLDVNREQKHKFYALNDDSLVSTISMYSASAMEQLEMDVISRMDFRIDGDGIPKLFDMAETPGINPGHAVAEALKTYDADFDAWELVLALNTTRALKKIATEATSVPGD